MIIEDNKRYWYDDNTVRSIIEEVNSLFLTDTKEEVHLNIKKIQMQLKDILNNVTFIEKQNEKINEKGEKTIETIYLLQRSSVLERQLLVKGYAILQSFRNFLTNSTLTYRYYITNLKGDVKLYQLSEEQILKSLSGNSDILFDIRQGEISKQEEVTKEDNDSFFQHFLNIYNIILTSEMQHPEGKESLYMVKEYIMKKYKYPKNLLHDNTNNYQFFNKGHIVEGLDISMYDVGWKNKKNKNYEAIKRRFYTKNLVYDNVIGFKGGDNSFTNTQIKSSKASLMKFKTIYDNIVDLSKTLEISDGKKLKEALTNQFINVTGEAISNTIDETVFNNLLKDIQNNS